MGSSRTGSGPEKISLDEFIRQIVNKKHPQRLLPFGPPLGMLMILFFAVALCPYFVAGALHDIAARGLGRRGVRMGDFYHFDRHRIASLRGMDQFWCEYCEWANGTLQWITAQFERELRQPAWRMLAALPLLLAGLVPLGLYMLFFNRAYFWIRRQHRFPLGPYLRRARGFQSSAGGPAGVVRPLYGVHLWIAAIVQEIERRYCPIQNHAHPHCAQAKVWRDGFLRYDPPREQVMHYYARRYLAEAPRHDD